MYRYVAAFGLVLLAACNQEKPDPRNDHAPLVFEETKPKVYNTPFGLMTLEEYVEELRRRRCDDQKAHRKPTAPPCKPYCPDPVNEGTSTPATVLR